MNTSSTDVSLPSDPQHDGTPLSLPCRTASPFNINYGLLFSLVRAGKAYEACIALRRATPFGGILSALGDPAARTACPHSAEKNTFSALLRHLEHICPDILYATPEQPPSSGKTALVIGSGPAGLQAAWTLREHGHAVTVLEAAPSPGMTLLREPVQESSSTPAAPSPAVPVDIVEKTLAMLTLSGIEFQCSHPVGQTMLDALCKEYDLILCACGKGAVLPTDADGKVRDNLFAAGTCVKNQKLQGALQSMASAKKTALAACRALDGSTAPQAIPDAPFMFPENHAACSEHKLDVPEELHELALYCRSCQGASPSDITA
ncbi:NAD(P)-binding protein [uncultured Mailhella sp.]|uniref:NAD(P)-binding protein n=1 Tax=uncultured Mailhella sp. TaxID=1981031 RepID=UPI0025E19A63|nr:NAD(P)-binding protein [uncultured Mailhella sp.]